MATRFESVLEQALALPEEERGDLAARLLRSLEPDDTDELSTQEWDAAWSTELDRRVREVRDGSAELVEGDDVLAELHAIAGRP
jgi:hypothetical protein